MDDSDNVGGPPRLIPNLDSKYLNIRLHAASSVAQRFHTLTDAVSTTPEHDITVPTRRLGRALIYVYVNRHHHEKSYIAAIETALVTALTTTARVQIDMATFVLDQLAEAKALWRTAAVKAAAVMDLCLLIAGTSLPVVTVDLRAHDRDGAATTSLTSDAAIEFPGWLSSWIDLCGDCLESISMGAGSQQADAKLGQRCTARFGEYLLSVTGKRKQSALQLTGVVKRWSESGLLAALSGLYSYVFNVSSGHPFLPGFKATLLDLVDKKVLSAKQPVASTTLQRLGQFFALLAPADWTDSAGSIASNGSDEAGSSFEALLLRTMKKSPEGSAAAAGMIVEHFGRNASQPVDMSNFIRDGAAAATLRALKSPNASVRENGQLLARALGRRCGTNVAALDEMARAVLCDALGAKTGPNALVQPYQRLACYVALIDCAPATMTSLPDAAVSELAVSVLGTLTSSLDRETDENNTLLAAVAVGRWLRCVDAMPAASPLLAVLKAGVASKGKGTAYGLALCTAVSYAADFEDDGDELAGMMAGTAGRFPDPEQADRARRDMTASLLVGPLATALAGIVKVAATKPQLAHLDAVFAMRLLVQAAIAAPEAAAAIETNKLWAVISSQPSFLYARALLQLAGLPRPQGVDSTGKPLISVPTAQTQAQPSRGVKTLHATVAESLAVITSTVALSFPVHLGNGLGLGLGPGPKSSSSATSSSKAAVDSLSGPVGNVVAAVLHPVTPVRVAVMPLVSALLKTGGLDACQTLLSALHDMLLAWIDVLGSADAVAAVVAPGAPDEDSPGSAMSGGALSDLKKRLGVPPSSRLAAVFAEIVTHTVLLSRGSGGDAALCSDRPQLAALLLLTASNPLVAESRARATCLLQSSGLGPALFGDSSGASVGANSDGRRVLAQAVVGCALTGPSMRRTTAHTALYLMASACGAGGRACLVSYVKPTLLSRLSGSASGNSDDSGVLSVSEEDVDKVMDPLGAAAVAKAAVEVNEADIRITNADRAGKKGKFGQDVVEDDDWAERVRKEKAAKLLQAKAAAVGESAAARAKEVDEISGRVRVVAERSQFALEALAALCGFRLDENGHTRDSELRAVVRNFIPDAMPLLLPLLRCRLVAPQAHICVLGMARTVDSDLLVATATAGSSIAHDLADALRIVATVADRPLKKKETRLVLYRDLLLVAGPLQRLLRAVGTYVGRLSSQQQQQQQHGASAKHQLSKLLPSTVCLLYPVLRGVLSMPSLLPGCELSLMVLDALWPRPDSFADDDAHAATAAFGSADLAALEGPSTAASCSLLSLQPSVTHTILVAMARLRLEPAPDGVLCRVVSQYPNLPLAEMRCQPSIASAVAGASQQTWFAPLLDEDGLLSPEVHVRSACLRALRGLFDGHQPPEPLVAAAAADPVMENRLWLLRFDEDDAVKALATQVWEARVRWLRGRRGLSAEWLKALLPLLSHEGRPPIDALAPADASSPPLPGSHVRLAAGRAVAGAVKELGESAAAVEQLRDLFKSRQPSRSLLSSSPSSSSSLSSSAIGKVLTPSHASSSASAPSVGIGAKALGIGMGMGMGVPAKKPAAVNAASVMNIGLGKPKPKPAMMGVGVGFGIGGGLGGAAKPVPAPSTSGLAGANVNVPKRLDAAAVIVDPAVNVATRLSLAQAFLAVGEERALGERDDDAVALDLLDFIMAFGVTDVNAEVRSAMLKAARAIVDGYGAEHCRAVILRLEAMLVKKPSAASNKGGKKDDSRDDASGGSKYKGPEDVASSDHRHQAAVVLMGAVGRHLASDDPAVISIAESMVAALSTPSEMVQRAVADCLVLLVQAMKATHADRAKEMLEGLIKTLLENESYAEIRGAAFGLSAFVKGLGIPCLKAHDVVPRLKDAAAEGSVSARQGALCAFECLSERLGLLFEPYVITFIPVLLKSFSHASDHVREAAQMAAKAVMGKLSAHGVKQVLTPILASLPEETQWKSRAEAIKLLGTMAHCAPKQLSACLPQIVPRLVEAGSDPHPKVKEGAKAAMYDISSVIRNPEISRLSPVLLAAMSDPATRTKEALEALLETEFMHSIDAPSLALLVPILGRALRDRGADLKRKSSAITGNMVSMVSDSKALVPYLPQVTPGLQDCLLDPIPDVRASAAKALGSLLGGVGEEEMPELVPWLLRTLSSEASPTDRAGSAQGLAEAALALGPQRMDEILDLALALRSHAKSGGREGLLWLLSFMPATLNETFAPHISRTLPVILAGLSDSAESVREVALRAGQVMVSCLGTNHASLLLPSLVDGLFDEDWRIRHSSLALLGDLLYLVSETKAGAATGGDDDEDEDEDLAGSIGASSRAVATLRTNLGEKAANEVLAALYIVRADVSITVRQSALQVWKAVVANTPRVLLEIIAVLVEQLIAKLASPLEDLRMVAGRSLGELVRKLGDRVLPKVVPHLRAQLRQAEGDDGDDAEAMKQGVCLGLVEILGAASKSQVEAYIGTLVPALQTALCDRSDEVRSLAAKGFQTLFKNIGPRAVDDVVPALLLRLHVEVKGYPTRGSGGSEAASEAEEEDDDGPESQRLALLGLQGLTTTRPRDLLEYLIDPSVNASGGSHGHQQIGKLMRHPMSAAAARTLAAVLAVSGNYLSSFYSTLVPALCLELLTAGHKMETASDDEAALATERERMNDLKAAVAALMGAVSTSGVGFLVSELSKMIGHESDVRRRCWGAFLAEQLFRHCKAAYNELVPVLLKNLLSRVAESDRPLLQAVSDAIAALAASPVVSLDELSGHLTFMQSCVGSTASDARHRAGAKESLYSAAGEFLLPLFTVPKSLDPFLTICLHALMNGSIQQRETAADLITELSQWTDPAALKPYLIKTTGPLIRVVGDRFPSNVKAAILSTLTVLLDRGGAGLKAFVPQLQTTFVKALTDSSRAVRGRASAALGRLMPLTTRVDPLLMELCAACAQAEGSAIRASALDAVAVVLIKGGDKATKAAFDKVRAIACGALLTSTVDAHPAAAACLSALGQLSNIDAAAVTDIVFDLCDGAKGGTEASMCGALLGTAAIIQTAGQRSTDARDDAFDLLSRGVNDAQRPSVQAAACAALGTIFTVPPPVLGGDASEEAEKTRKGECRATVQAVLSAFSSSLSQAAANGAAEDTRLAGLTAIKSLAKNYPVLALQHIARFLPSLASALRDIHIRHKYVAERALRHLLLTADEGSGSGLVENATAIGALAGADAPFVRDYVRRIVMKQAADSDDEAEKW